MGQIGKLAAPCHRDRTGRTDHEIPEVGLASPLNGDLAPWRTGALVNTVQAMDTARLIAPSRTGGPQGNERLTAMTGAVLLILLLVECYTVLSIGRLLTLHVFLGMLLLGPVTLKAGSVLYRFARYYTGSAPYRRKGPPAPLLRVIGPIIMLLTAALFGSGIMLAVTGPSYGPGNEWLEVHRFSFIAWAFFISIHVLTYVWRLPRLLAAEARGTSYEADEAGERTTIRWPHARRAMELLGGRGTRLTLLTASLLAGLVIALLTVHLAGHWEQQF
jgi:hypothetical protein